MVDYGFALAPGEEAFIGVSPDGMHSDEYVTKIPMEKRGCYTASERQLAYYHHYSLLNCYMECVSNYTDHVCATLLKTQKYFSLIIYGLNIFSIVGASRSTCHGTPPRPRSAPLRS